MKINIKTHILVPMLTLIGCIVLLPNLQAVVPAPDGGYPGGNTAEGQTALLSLTTGGFNTAAGFLSLRSNTTGSFNTAIGAGTLLANTADENTATGAGALLSNTTGTFNTANGVFALFSNTTGFGNTGIGFSALYHSNGISNTAVGGSALFNNSSGNNNIALGFNAGINISTADNVICIGADGHNVSNSCYIGHIAGQTVGAGGSTCYVDNDGKLGVFLSARRFKTDIADMAAASEAILALRPVTFHYKPELDKTGIPQFGLVAEEVAKVNPDLVTHDAKGELSTVRYEAVNAMLLNEFLKEHRTVQEQATMIARLNSTVEKQETTAAQQAKEIQVLTASLKEQASQIQKVSAQFEMNKAAPQVALDNR